MTSARLARWTRQTAVAAAVLAVAGCSSSGGTGGSQQSASAPASSTVKPPLAGSPSPSGQLPRPAHTVVVVLENHAYSQVIGSAGAPYLNQLARGGALFTNSYAITHPSEPNYLALFSGSTHGVTSDACPVSYTAPNLASRLIEAGDTFTGYAEGLPGAGSQVCSAGEYARKHVPWADFSNVPTAVNRPFTSFPQDFSRLPTVSFVIPNLCNDMHDCSVATGDGWLRTHLSSYVSWAMTHDSLLIITWDEDDDFHGNHIPTIFTGQQVRPGTYQQKITHYSVLATIEAACGLQRDGGAATAQPITFIWRS